jgi:division protein CdvB (Snf7/Vps24/ESCRT-III family)
MSISRRWNETQQGESITDKFLDKIKSQEPLKLRIEEAQNKLQIQISKLDKLSAKLHEKDRVIFGRIVQSVQSPDSYYAKILSSELSQVRKMSKIVDSAKIAFEQIRLRLNTVTELGDVVVTLSPAMSVIQGIQGGLSSMMPKADQSFGEMSELLVGIMTQSTQIPTIADNEMVTNTELSEEALWKKQVL